MTAKADIGVPVQAVEVIAPADLPEGYEFAVKDGEMKFTVQVVSE